MVIAQNGDGDFIDMLFAVGLFLRGTLDGQRAEARFPTADVMYDLAHGLEVIAVVELREVDGNVGGFLLTAI